MFTWFLFNIFFYVNCQKKKKTKKFYIKLNINKMILHDKPGYWFLVWNPDLDPIFFFFFFWKRRKLPEKLLPWCMHFTHSEIN